MFLKIFKRRSKISPVSKQAGSVVTTQPAVARRRSEASHRMLIDIGRKLKNVEAAVADHDGYVREHVVTRLSIRELIEALQKQLQVIPSAKSVDLNEMKNTTENHKKVLAFLAHDPSTTYTYQELADMTHLTANGVRGMISQLSKRGYRFKKGKQGKKVTVKLIPSALNAQALPRSDSSASSG